ncbi:MAG: efflux RND transporter permease subunit [Thermoanaerobaculales bacterium]|jgi:HAE1 family hydrophobic/amphiphilic exporter-1|nr:efflux RND transporter permease subunit [Thermoanaerobaculales bacterium]
MNLPTLAVRRPITTAMILVSILLVGGIAFVRLPLAFLPEVDAPFMFVQIPYQNSHPRQIEREITKPVEETLSTLSGVKSLNSTTDADGAQFFMEFTWGDDIDVIRMKVSEKMDQVEPTLPDDIGPILIFSFNTNDIPVVQGRIAAEGVDLSQNYELLEARILNPLRRIDGVARVDLNGVEPRELFVDLILDKIKEHSVDVGALAQLLQSVSSNMVLGRAESGGLRYTVRSLGSFDSIEDLQELVIDERGLRLGDVAEISYEEPPLSFGRHLDGKYAVALDVYKESTANTVEVVREVNRLVEEEINNDPLLKGIQLWVWQDQAEEITNGVNSLKKAGLTGALLATLSLYFFLRRMDSTVIVAMSIPFSIIATCGMMYFLGSSLNILSMMGLMLAVGMLVDNAIVVLESVDRRMRSEGDRRKAALEGAGQVLMAVTASTATTLIVFLPLVIGSGTEMTTWLKEIGITISIALGCSLFSSLTLIPLMSAHMLKPKDNGRNRFVEWLEERYVRVLGWTLQHRVKTFFLLIVGLGVGLLPFFAGWVDSAIFSGTLNNRLYLAYEFDDFHYKSQSESAVNLVEAALETHADELMVDTVYSYYTENEAGTTINFTRDDLSDDDLKEMRTAIREKLPEIPGVRLVFEEDADEGGSTTYFAVKLFGQDTTTLYRIADEAARRLETMDGVEDVSRPRATGRREVQVSIDRARIAELDRTAADITQMLAFTLGGVRLDRFNAGDREIVTWLALRLEDRSRLDDLQQIPITEAGGKPVLLGDVATFEIIQRPRAIQRENRKVRVAVRGAYDGDDWAGTQQAVEEMMNAFNLPAGYSWSWNDRIVEQANEDAEMGVNFLLALVLVYLVMASLFESLTRPFAILFAIPFALPGTAWMLAATGTPFNLMAQIGLLILMGIVVNNGIVLVDHMNHFRRQGFSAEESILRAGRDRLRPILMTAATTIIGLLPLAIGTANASGLLYYPMARTVMGGLMSSVVLTLLVLPYITLGTEGLSNWMRRVWHRSARRRLAPAEATGSSC